MDRKNEPVDRDGCSKTSVEYFDDHRAACEGNECYQHGDPRAIVADAYDAAGFRAAWRQSVRPWRGHIVRKSTQWTLQHSHAQTDVSHCLGRSSIRWTGSGEANTQRQQSVHWNPTIA